MAKPKAPNNKKGAVVETKKKVNTRSPRIPRDTGMKYNIETNKYEKRKAPSQPRPQMKKDVVEKDDKKDSKSKKFWKLQSEKAASKKKDSKKEVDNDFETVSGWQSGSDVESLSEESVSGESIASFDQELKDESMEDKSGSEDEVEEDIEEDEDNMDGTKSMIQSVNRKGKKSGGFQSMGLSFPVFKAIQHQGYKIPTPIQRKSIPLIMDGGDVVAMARTGSGKTAAFLIPLVERLKTHSVKVGVRALILSPSRELASQTYKFLKDLAKYTDLRPCVFVGGENMDTQFAALASNPDVIVATPGRLMHLIIEAKLEMKAVEYLVFDEADRLFEMGFAEQLREIVTRIPPARQTLLFSATLPKILVDFARAGLQNPSLLRLDVDTKISRELQMYFFNVKNEEKDGALIYLLTNTIPKAEQVVIFVATKHHVEYLHQLMVSNGILSTYIYGTLDPAARKIHLARFRHAKVRVMVVTDVAARGIDVPLLDHVINYNFPSSSKVFVHRVGRTARAGKAGSAWSLIAQEELPYMLDLQLFTGRPLIYSHLAATPNYTTQLVYGHLPAEMALAAESVTTLVKGNLQLETMKESSKQGYKMYLRSRPPATKASHSRSKQVSAHSLGLHPLYTESQTQGDRDRENMITALAGFRPMESVFEIGKKGKTTPEALLMEKRRKQFASTIVKQKDMQTTSTELEVERQKKAMLAVEEDISIEMEGFKDITAAEKSKKRKDKEFYLDYRPVDDATEAGYAVHGNDFNAQAQKASLDLVADEISLLKKKAVQTWDPIKHRFVSSQIGGDNKKRVRTENGTLIPASFQSDRFAQWQKRTKVDIPRVGEHELASAAKMGLQQTSRFRHNSNTAPTLDSKSFKRKQDTQETKWRKEGLQGSALLDAKDNWIKDKGFQEVKSKKGGAAKAELKTTMQIVKEREQLDKRREKTGRHAHIARGGSSRGGSSRGGFSRGGSSRGGSSRGGSSRGGSSRGGSSRGGSSRGGHSRGGS